MTKPTTNTCTCAARLDALEKEFAEIGEVAARRRDRAIEAQRMADVEMFTRDRDTLVAWLAQHPNRAQLLQLRGIEAVDIVVSAPAPLRDEWTSYLIPAHRARVQLALVGYENIPHYVWLSGDQRFAGAVITPDQARALTEVGQGAHVDTRNVRLPDPAGRERWGTQLVFAPAKLHGGLRQQVSTRALQLMRTLAPDLDAAIVDGSVTVAEWSREENEAAYVDAVMNEGPVRSGYATYTPDHSVWR